MVETIPLTYLPLFLHCMIGLVAARIAYRKGYDLGRWMLWGMVGGTLALVDALRRSQCPESPSL